MAEERALLLTDLVDSTRLAETLGDAAAAELGAAHDRVARDLLRACRGREIDKTDGMLALFDKAADAATFAMAYHQALAALPVPVQARVGLHVGAVILRTNPPQDVAHGAKPLEVEGVAKPLAARIMSLALGGQTLMSAEARTALGDTPLRVQSHGHWRIKGIGEPVELFELGADGAPFTPPPDSAKVYRVVRQDELWMPVQQVRHSLPAERDAFVGRQEVLVDLARRFDAGARLVSLLGMGGTGKTRLATRFARTWLGDYPGGAWFCDLSQARDVDGLVRAVAHGLEVPLGKDDPIVQLGHAIAGRGRCLVILDNFEQISRHADETLGRWLDRAVDARFLVTTREVLGLPGEEALALAPLGASDAVSLFMRRARSARHDFEPGAEDQTAIAQLVRLLDRLPLAIELAAARVRVMSAGDLLARMGDRFKLLAAMGGRQDRQATLRATFDWSWDLLSDAEKAALAQLSVFEGGFTLQAAEAVLELSACTAAPWAVDVVHSLVDKSLVRQLGDTRFDMLVGVQEYAAEQLQRVGRFPGSGVGARQSAELAHCRHFASLDMVAATANGGVETDNLVVACRRATDRGEASLAAEVLESAWEVLDLRGPFRVGVELAEAALVLAADPRDVARVNLVAGRATKACGLRAQATGHFEAALGAARAARDDICESYALCFLGQLHGEAGHAESAQACHEQSLEKARVADDPVLSYSVLNAIANSLMDHGSFDAARIHFERALQVARAAGLERFEGGVLGNLGNLEMELGHVDEARSIGKAALAIALRAGDLKFAGNTLSNLGLIDHLVGRAQDAKAQFEESLAIARSIGHRHLECIVLCNLGIHFDALKAVAEARHHFELALGISTDLQDHRAEGQILGYLGLAHGREGKFVEARRCLTAGEALLRELADPISQALLLCARAETEQMAGRSSDAERYLREAESLAQHTGPGPDSELGMALSRVRGSLATA